MSSNSGLINEYRWFFVKHMFALGGYVIVTRKRGNVEKNNSPQAGIEPGASRFKIQHSIEWAKEISH